MVDKILQGDVRSCLKQLEDESVQCVISSPPYWGLRDYGTATWEGGDPNCDHLVGRFTTPVSDKQATSVGSGTKQASDVCPKCGARRIDSQIGLEPTPEAYVADLVEVFREVKRVLRDDGVLWLNLGDSYAGSGRGRNADGTHSKGGKEETNRGAMDGRLVNAKSFSKHLIEEGAIGNAWVKPPVGYKCKDLCMIPAQVAIALRIDGWYLRSKIIWNKLNPMPESVTDRPTKSYEEVFLFSKSSSYYYDAESIKEPIAESTAEDPRLTREGYDVGRPERGFPGGNSRGSGLLVPKGDPGKRNKRDVWTVATQPCAEAHFATFPPKLIEPMILAGSKEGDTILDPFMGSGTTAIQAVRLHRHYLGCELNPEYVAMANRRIADMVGPLFSKERV